MSVGATVERLTAEEFYLRCTDERAELIEGKVVPMAPAGGSHGAFSTKLAGALLRWAEETGAGVVVSGETGFILARDPDTVRAPDAAYIAWERLGDRVPDAFCPVAPDLAVEVVSPSDRRADVLAKVGAWLAAGTRVVWVVWAESQRIWVCRPDTDPAILGPGEALISEDVLPGFSLPVDAVFAATRRPDRP